MARMFVLVSLALLCSFGKASALAADQSSDQQFKAKEDSILATARANGWNDVLTWTELALNEIAAGRVSKGVEYESLVMHAYTPKDVKNSSGVLGFLGSRVIYGLTQHGYSKEAEQLLVDAVERTQAVAGPKAVATQAQIADLFVFYVDQGNYQAALRTLDQVLDFDLTTGETPTQSLTHFSSNVKCRFQPRNSMAVLHMVLLSIQQNKKAEPAFAIAAIEKVLKAQEVCLTADDERLVETLSALGDAYFQAKKYEKADGCYSRAYELSTQWHPGAFAVRQCGQNFLANLKEVGRTTEADRLSNLKWEGTFLEGRQPKFPLPF